MRPPTAGGIGGSREGTAPPRGIAGDGPPYRRRPPCAWRCTDTERHVPPSARRPRLWGVAPPGRMVPGLDGCPSQAHGFRNRERQRHALPLPAPRRVPLHLAWQIPNRAPCRHQLRADGGEAEPLPPSGGYARLLVPGRLMEPPRRPPACPQRLGGKGTWARHRVRDDRRRITRDATGGPGREGPHGPDTPPCLGAPATGPPTGLPAPSAAGPGPITNCHSRSPRLAVPVFR